MANKQDLRGALSLDAIREVRRRQPGGQAGSCESGEPCASMPQALRLHEIRTHHWSIVACSAVTGENLVEGLDWIVNDIAARVFIDD